MSYTPDMKVAARRLLDAARRLNGDERSVQVAAYLFGLAAECALKAVAQELPGARRDAVFYAHFPELRTALRDVISGRRAKYLRALIEDNNFLNDWDIKIRYARAEEIRSKPIKTWEAQAVRAVSLMEGP